MWREHMKTYNYSFFLSLKSIQLFPNSNPNFFPKFSFFPFLSSNQSSFTLPRYRFLQFSLSSTINPNPNFSESNFNSLCTILKTPNLDLQNALKKVQIQPSRSLMLAIFKRFDSSPVPVFSLFKWAEKQTGYDFSPSIFKLMVNILVKSGEFKWALMVILNEIKKGDGYELVSPECLGILIRHYARFGNVLLAIKVFEFGKVLEIDVFDSLLSALCRYNHVMVGCDCIDRKMYLEPEWAPSIDVYNTLLEGWFRVKDVKEVERVWVRMKGERVVPSLVSYGILVEGFCKLGLVDSALEVLGEMRRDGVGCDGRVFGPLVGALAGAGRLKEALGMLERFLVLEEGPNMLTYNLLIRGFCKAGDLVGAGKIIRMMISRGVMPTAMTYIWFFRYYTEKGKVEEGVNLYRKMIESGYDPDVRTFHLLLRMLCVEEKLELAMQIRKDMRSRGLVLDLNLSTMLIALLCKMHKLEEAVVEFEDLIKSGCVPNHHSYKMLHSEIKKKGLHIMALKVSELVANFRSSTSLPNDFGVEDTLREKRKSIILKAKAMSNKLKARSEPKELIKRSRSGKRSLVGKTRKLKKG